MLAGINRWQDKVLVWVRALSAKMAGHNKFNQWHQWKLSKWESVMTGFFAYAANKGTLLFHL